MLSDNNKTHLHTFSKNIQFALFLAIICLALSCEKTPVTPIDEGENPADTCFHQTKEASTLERIVFLGHTYHLPYSVDERLEYLVKQKYLDQFQHVWLGGDMCSETTKDSTTLDYMNCLFDLSHPHTLWAPGNHDVRNGNTHFITNITERPLYYTTTLDNLVVMVLNTNLEEPDCDELDTQLAMLTTVCDTIQDASHLVVLTHHVIWGDADDGIRNISMWDRANGNKAFWLSECKPNTKFHQTLYPLFTAVQDRGIQVVFIAGDYGQREKEFQYLTEKGIWLIGSGIARTYTEHNGVALPSDHILELTLDKTQRELTWEFVNLDSLALVW